MLDVGKNTDFICSGKVWKAYYVYEKSRHRPSLYALFEFLYFSNSYIVTE